jgi:hypothetical protein
MKSDRAGWNHSGLKPPDTKGRMNRNRFPWTPEENERLRGFVAKNVSIIKVAGALNRSTTSVRNQARKLGTPFPTMKDYRKKFGDSPSSSWRLY